MDLETSKLVPTDPPTLENVRANRARDNANPYCMRCGDDRGGPYGHESNECTWNR